MPGAIASSLQVGNFTRCLSNDVFAVNTTLDPLTPAFLAAARIDFSAALGCDNSHNDDVLDAFSTDTQIPNESGSTCTAVKAKKPSPVCQANASINDNVTGLKPQAVL